MGLAWMNVFDLHERKMLDYFIDISFLKDLISLAAKSSIESRLSQSTENIEKQNVD